MSERLSHRVLFAAVCVIAVATAIGYLAFRGRFDRRGSIGPEIPLATTMNVLGTRYEEAGVYVDVRCEAAALDRLGARLPEGAVTLIQDA